MRAHLLSRIVGIEEESVDQIAHPCACVDFLIYDLFQAQLAIVLLGDPVALEQPTRL